MTKQNIKNYTQTQRELIYLLLKYKTCIDSFYASGLTKDHFDEEHQPLISAILEVYENHDVLLSRKFFKSRLNSINSPKERISQELIYNACCSATVEQNDFQILVSNLVDYYAHKEINHALTRFNKTRIEKNNIVAVKDLLDDCSRIVDGSTGSYEKIYYEDIRALSKDQIQYMKDLASGKIIEDPLILSGIKEIDYTMVTGFERGTLTIFTADVGGFKSTMMLNIALNVWHNGHDVLLVPLEMHRNQMWRKACARESKVLTERLTRGVKDLTQEEWSRIEKMQEEWENNPAKFFIMQEPGNTTVSKIQRQIERNIELIKPKLVVIDYVANLEAQKQRYNRNDLEIGDMLKAMRQMGKDLGFAVISAAQLGRDALKRLRKAGANKDKPSINSEDIRGSHEYSADADNIYAQLKSVAQPNELLDLYVVKARNGLTVFENGEIRASLSVFPEIGLIKSSDDFDGDMESGVDDILGIVAKTEEEEKVTSSLFDEYDDIFNSDEDNSDILDSIADSSDQSDDDEIDGEW